MEEIRIKDKNNRILFESKGNRFIIARFVNMDINTKNAMAELYSDLTGCDEKKVIEFLNFEINQLVMLVFSRLIEFVVEFVYGKIELLQILTAPFQMILLMIE